MALAEQMDIAGDEHQYGALFVTPTLEESDQQANDTEQGELLEDERFLTRERILAVQNWIKGNDYQWAADRFRTVAEDSDLLPNQVQAITWMTWRRMHGINDMALSGQLELEFVDEAAAA